MLLMVFNDRHFEEIWRFHGKKHLQNNCKKKCAFFGKIESELQLHFLL